MIEIGKLNIWVQYRAILVYVMRASCVKSHNNGSKNTYGSDGRHDMRPSPQC